MKGPHVWKKIAGYLLAAAVATTGMSPVLAADTYAQESGTTTAKATVAESTRTADFPGNCEDGIYKVQADLYKVDRQNISMSNSALQHFAKITVSGGTATVSVNFNSLEMNGTKGYLKAIKYYESGYTTTTTGKPQGTLADATVDSYQARTDGSRYSDDYGTDYPNDVTFPLIEETKNDGFLPLQMNIPIMDALMPGYGTQYAYLKLDYSTMVKTTAEDSDFAEKEIIPAEKKEEPQQETKKAPTIKVKKSTLTVKYKNVKKKTQTISSGITANSGGKMTYTKVSDKKSKKITVNQKTGKLTVKKGIKKGTYKFKVKVSVAAKGNYKAGKKTVTLSVKVK